MIEISRIREQKDEVVNGLKVRGLDVATEVEQILNLDKQWRTKKQEMDSALAEMNQISKEIGQLFQQGKKDEAEAAKQKTGELKERSQTLKTEFSDLEKQINDLLLNIPNVPNKLVPEGATEDDNEVVFEKGTIPTFDFNALPHWDLATKYDIIDWEMGVKVTGAGFPFYKNQGARLQRGLINFFLDEAIKAGYSEYVPPFVINEDSGYGTGQLPDKEGQMYQVTADNLYLIPTSEVPLVNTLRGDRVKKEDLPIKLTAYSPCFRREAGSYGKDVRGLNRLHQFDKVELVMASDQESSYQELDKMVEHVKGLLEKLELPYRILRLCGGDLGVTAAITYDFEVYSTAQERWLEISSCSNVETYQANRMKLRYKDEEGNTKLCHTLNGSALALPRVIAGILENHQDANGINMPKALVPYVGFERIQ
ncbi:MAG: serine--tRNA ligase [Crocinitomicaceae bacterium]|nr:serine--tRNA ligase [Crocinitomicaceae bacterium]